ncbi:MAG: M48 family metalloprotease [Oleiphilaceae bacterium]|nr:M48 family metalloprotease [Oleiphilaceae bacterium]
MHYLKPTCIATLLTCLLLSACGVRIQGIELGRIYDSLGSVPDLFDKDTEDEIEIGRQTADTLLKHYRVSPNTTLQQYVSTVGYWLVKHSSRPKLPWRFIVIEDEAFNAFAAPGGYIFVTTGTLMRIGSESELAAILAHEMAHVLFKHHLEALQDSSQIGLASNLAILAAQGYRANQASNREDLDGPEAISLFEKSVMSLYEKGLERDDEMEADRVAVLLSARAGYDHYAFAATLQYIASHETQHHAHFDQFVASHPSAEERLMALEPTLLEMDARISSPRTLSDRYAQVLQSAIANQNDS